ncbi:MAG: T9SS type A sorting domain-containing protein [Bacteroidetes bacterium]|nr:T9SS type A sorting domain-containing protein [Bacteroidota bacterium]
MFSSFITVTSVTAQTPLSSGDGELIFERDDNNFVDPVTIRLELVGIVFNELGEYRLTVDPQNDEANAYPAGSYLTGTGPDPANAIALPTSGSPRQITWESAAADDSPAPNYAYGTYFEYCPGMVGWGLYKVTVSREYEADLVFYINLIDGNWLNPSFGAAYDIRIRVRTPWFGSPVCHVYDYNTYSFVAIAHNSTIAYWDISGYDRGRDQLERTADYSVSPPGIDNPAPFTIVDNTDYPLEHGAIGVYIDDVILDVNTELVADEMTIPSGKAFEIREWIDPQSVVESTTLTAHSETGITVSGELRLYGSLLDPLDYSVKLVGETPDRGFWHGILAGDGGTVLVDHANIHHARRAIMLGSGATLTAEYMDIAEFSQYGVHQTDALAQVWNSTIHDGSIGVFATGDCRESYYGKSEYETNIYPVEVYDCDGHGFELVDLVSHFDIDGSIENARSFCVQYAQIRQNFLYGVWVRGDASPLIQENDIFDNGRYGGQTPSHDGIHVNFGFMVSVHYNSIWGNAYGVHHNDGGGLYGEVFPSYGGPSLFPDYAIVQDFRHGMNCLVRNTINLGANRSAFTMFGHLFSGEYEADLVTERKRSGSNSILDPVSGYHASNGTATVYAEHNCWEPFPPQFSGQGPIITDNDFADCATHKLPDCASVPPAPGQGGEPGTLASFSTACASQNMTTLQSLFDARDWSTLKNTALNVLASSSNYGDVSVAANMLGRLIVFTGDRTIEKALEPFLQQNGTAYSYPLHTRHAVLCAKLFIRMHLRDATGALAVCTRIAQHCAGTEYAKTGELFRASILGSLQGRQQDAVNVVEAMLQRDPDDAEAIAMYYSLTHRYPGSTPKRVVAQPDHGVLLHANYPNPFGTGFGGNVTEIRFTVPKTVHARLYVRDVTGRLLRVLVDDNVTQGTHAVSFDATALNSGMYFYTLETEFGIESRRMIVIR